MRHKEPNPYFQLQRGLKVREGRIREEAPQTMSAVDVLKKNGEIIGQYPLPGLYGETPDMQIWMPKRIRELEIATQKKLDKVRAELIAISKGEEFDQSIFDPKREAPMTPGVPYVLKSSV